MAFVSGGTHRTSQSTSCPPLITTNGMATTKFKFIYYGFDIGANIEYHQDCTVILTSPYTRPLIRTARIALTKAKNPVGLLE